jgi:GTPase SAR1 family protein
MGVGKTSIIERFVKDEFESANNVLSKIFSPQSASIFCVET